DRLPHGAPASAPSTPGPAWEAAAKRSSDVEQGRDPVDERRWPWAAGELGPGPFDDRIIPGPHAGQREVLPRDLPAALPGPARELQVAEAPFDVVGHLVDVVRADPVAVDERAVAEPGQIPGHDGEPGAQGLGEGEGEGPLPLAERAIEVHE